MVTVIRIPHPLSLYFSLASVINAEKTNKHDASHVVAENIEGILLINYSTASNLWSY